MDSGLLTLSRRTFLASTALATMAPTVASVYARSFPGGTLPFEPGRADPPRPVLPGPWQALTAAEGRLIEAIVERLIPADELSVSGKDARCAVYIDRQLAGDYGTSARRYMRGPFQQGIATLGDQSPLTPLGRYRAGLAALERHCRDNFAGTSFADLTPEQRDGVLMDLEADKVPFAGGVTAAVFFRLVLQNTMEGFFADPIYGGNRDMVSWKMIGFPGTRYDFRDHVAKHNQKYPLPPVGIMGRAAWLVGN